MGFLTLYLSLLFWYSSLPGFGTGSDGRGLQGEWLDAHARLGTTGMDYRVGEEVQRTTPSDLRRGTAPCTWMSAVAAFGVGQALRF